MTPKVDNDPTKTAAKPFLIIAGVRTGGTFLAHCLSNHSQVYCDRGETMHQHYIWRKKLSAPAHVLLHILTHQEGYFASGFRMVYSQAFHKELWPHVVELNPLVIHLTRANVLRQAVSFCYHQEIRKGRAAYYPVHTFFQQPPPKRPVTIGPETILYFCRQFVNANVEARRRFRQARLRVLPVEYAQLVGGEGMSKQCATQDVATAICNFLGVRLTPLCSDLKRVHQHPLSTVLANWEEVRTVVSKGPFAQWLEHEKQWRQVDGRWQIG